MEKVFKEAIQELDELIKEYIIKRKKIEEKFGKDSEEYKMKNDVIDGFYMRKRQTKYLADKFGIKL